MVDERKAGVSGCSTDSSVRFIKSLGEKYKVDFFNRTNLAFVVKGQNPGAAHEPTLLRRGKRLHYRRLPFISIILCKLKKNWKNPGLFR
jgi:hypothetical protein